MKPRLIHPVGVDLVQINTALTVIDADFREATTLAWLPAVRLRGQVNYARTERLNLIEAGNNPVSDGHICFQADDLATAGVTIKIGDRFTAIVVQRNGAAVSRPVDYEVIEVSLRGHYTDYAGLLFAFFRDRTPGAGA